MGGAGAGAASFDAFAVEVMPRLRRLARAWTGDAHRADDLVQEALERVWRAWPRVRIDGNPAGYASTTLVCVLVSDSRRPWRRWEVLHPAGEHPGHDAVDRTAHDDGDAGAADGADLLAAVHALPPRQRAVVLLRFAEDQSVAQVAAALGCSEGTVKSQTSRALERLRGQLRPAAVDTEPLEVHP